MSLADRLRGLYGILDVPARQSPVELASALLEGGVRVIQLRMKTGDARAMLAACDALLPLCQRERALFIVNDRLDVALAAGADGVHLGQRDLTLADARRLAPAGFLIGISTHDLDQARAADAGGADYLGFGPVFATTTKENPDAIVGLAGLASACAAVRAPVVAIGGISLADAPALARAGATGAALISAIARAPDVAAAARSFNEAFHSAKA